MNEEYVFPCGCRWPITAPPNEHDPLPGMKVDYENIPFCSAVASLFASGNTLGIFQLEQNLGQDWSRKLKPTNREHVSALLAILRPGSLKAKDASGHTTTQKYVQRKNGEKPVEKSFHPKIDEILSETYGLIIYQELAIGLASHIAFFSEQEADELRAAIGKKLADKMAVLRPKFIEDCVKNGLVTEEEATELFDNIEKSNRYAFNKAHSWAYANICIKTAYIKSHFPLAFYLSWIGNAYMKGDSEQEVYDLIEDSKIFGVPVLCPNLLSRSVRATIYKESVVFGIGDISGIGDKAVADLLAKIELTEGVIKKPLEEWCWEDFLFYLAKDLTSKVVEGLISAGALSFLKRTRLNMLNEYRCFKSLTDYEKEWCALAYLSQPRPLSDLLVVGAKMKKEGGMAYRKEKIPLLKGEAKLLRNPPCSEEDHPRTIVDMEQKFLGAAVTFNRLTGTDTSAAGCQIIQMLNGYSPDMVDLVVEVKFAKEFETKEQKKKMSFLTISDESGTLNKVVCFPNEWAEFKRLLIKGNVVLVSLEKTKSGDSYCVKKVFQA